MKLPLTKEKLEECREKLINAQSKINQSRILRLEAVYGQEFVRESLEEAFEIYLDPEKSKNPYIIGTTLDRELREIVEAEERCRKYEKSLNN